MNKYEVNIKRTEYGFVTVEAENEDEARTKAYNAYCNGNVNWGDEETETQEVTKI